VYNNIPDPCGTVHLVIGDGGNREGPIGPWRNPVPSWSAFREASFGVGNIVFENASTALFQWHRHACGSSKKGDPYYAMNFSASCVSPVDNSAQRLLTSDRAHYRRPSKAQCPNKYKSTSFSPLVAPTPSPANCAPSTSTEISKVCAHYHLT